MKEREIPLHEYRRISEGDRFHAAFDLHCCIVFFDSAQATDAIDQEIVNDAIQKTRRALLYVGTLISHVKKDVYIQRVEHIFQTITQKHGVGLDAFRELRRLCQRVIMMLGITDDELKQEYEYYQVTQKQAVKDSLKRVFDFLYIQRIIKSSKFDSAQKARIHSLVQRYGEEKMEQRKVYRDYLEYRDTNKLRISSSTAVLGALAELLLSSDLPTSATKPLIEDVRKYNKYIADTVSSAQNQEEVDIDTFDVDAYLKKRFTKEHEEGHTRPDMDPKIIEEIDALSMRILLTLFPDLQYMDAAQRQQTIKKYIEVDGAIPHVNTSSLHVYEEDGDN